jgi:hypothetical protein
MDDYRMRTKNEIETDIKNLLNKKTLLSEKIGDLNVDENRMREEMRHTVERSYDGYTYFGRPITSTERRNMVDNDLDSHINRILNNPKERIQEWSSEIRKIDGILNELKQELENPEDYQYQKQQKKLNDQREKERKAKQLEEDEIYRRECIPLLHKIRSRNNKYNGIISTSGRHTVGLKTMVKLLQLDITLLDNATLLLGKIS